MPNPPPKEPGYGEPFDWRALWQSVERWLIGDLDKPARLSKIAIDDGDCIVIQSDRPLSMQNMQAIKQHVRLVTESLNVNAEVLVLDGGLDIKVLKTSQLPRRASPPKDWASAKSGDLPQEHMPPSI